MSDRNVVIQGLIELHVAGKGGTEAVESMKKILAQTKEVEAAVGGFGKKTDEATQKVGVLEKAFGKLGATVVGFFGAGILVRFAEDAFAGFAKVERQALVVENQIKSLGQATQGAGFRGFIRDLSDTSGILDDDLVPAFQKALTVYRDYNAATEALRIASKFAAAGIGEVGANVDALTTFFQTGMARGLKPFISDIKGGEDGTLSLAEGFKQLRATLETLGQPLDDAKSRFDALRNTFDELKDSAGASLDFVAQKVQIATRYYSDFIANVVAGFDHAQGQQQDLLNEQAAAAIKAKRAQDEKSALDKINDERDKVRNQEKADKIAADALKAETDRIAKVKDLEFAAAKDLLEQKIAFEEVGSQRRVDLELQLNAMLEAEAIRHANEIGAKTLDIEKFFAGERGRIKASGGETPSAKTARDDDAAFDPRAGFGEIEAAYKEHEDALTKITQEAVIERLTQTRDATIEGTQERLDAETALQLAQLKNETDAEVAAAKGDADLIAAINYKAELKKQGYLRATANVAKQLTMDRVNAEIDASRSIIQSLGTIFAKHKGFAIGMAIMNTALAIGQAWANEKLWYVALARSIAAAAVGLEQIRSIRGATPDGGGGGGGGGSPQIAAAPTQAAQSPASNAGSQQFTQSSGVAPMSASQFDQAIGRGAAAGPMVVVKVENAYGDITKLTREIQRKLTNQQWVVR